MVLPVLHALQGHPESGALWAKHIAKHLTDLGFKPLKHAPCIWIGSMHHQDVLLCKQVDDFQIAAADKKTIDAVISAIGGRVRFIGNKDLMTRFNGANFIQSRDYIKIHCLSFIDKILSSHGWNTPGKDDGKPIEPLHPDAVKELETISGPTVLEDKLTLEKEAGFGYRKAIGELLYAYVLCRLDIGYAMAELSKFSQNPDRCHYNAVKRVFRYL